MQCNKLIAVGVGVVVCLMIGVIVYFAWPGGDQETTVDVEGDDNRVTSTEKREVSLLHIEGLASAQRVSNWVTVMGFLAIMGAMGYAVFHYKVVREPRRLRKDMDRERMVDRLHDIEEVLVELGHMRKKRALRVKKKKGRMPKRVRSEIEDKEEEEEEEM